MKAEKDSVIRESEHREKLHEDDKRRLRVEIENLKTKIKDLSEENILNSLISRQPQASNQGDHLRERRL